MIAGEIQTGDAHEVSLVDRDDMLEALTTNRPDESLDVWRLPRRTARDDNFLDAHVLGALPEVLTVDRVLVADQKPGRSIIRKRFDDLLSRPLGCRMRGDVEVDDLSSMMTKNDEGEKYAELGVGTVTRSLATMSAK